jgi:anionic cell wall polymer biosynthesis LytR-Cps2A-Psr (LCP) family protein
VQISFIGFYDISDAIGGVPINLCHAVNDTVAYNRSVGSDGGSGFKMSAGHHTIKGVTALEFVRQRHNLPNGDLDRVRRQQYFLTAAFRQAASIGLIFKLHSLGDALKKDVYMDPGLHLLDLAHQMENLNASNIIGKTIPFEHFATESVGSVEIINPARVQKFVAKLVNPASSSPSASAGNASTSKSPKPSSSSSPKALDAKCIN